VHLTAADVGVNSRKSDFFRGVKDTFPLIVGAIPFGIIFGAVAAEWWSRKKGETEGKAA
jgi:predicted branched-subunit amino acid permease